MPTDRPTTEDPALSAADEEIRARFDVSGSSEDILRRVFEVGKRAGLEEAAKIAQHYGPSRPPISTRPSALILGRYEGECAASANIAEAISRAAGVKEG